MVSVVLALVIAGALMAFLISSIRLQDGISSRSVSVRQAELGFAQLTRDLREAQNLPDSTGQLSNGVKVANDSPVVITFTATTFTATFFLPNTTTPTSPGPMVTWSCSALSGGVYGTCIRQQGATTATEITGVSSATITPTATDGSAIGTATLTGPAGNLKATPPGSPSQYPSFVTIAVNVAPISQSDASGVRVVTGATPVTLKAGVNLRAWS